MKQTRSVLGHTSPETGERPELPELITRYVRRALTEAIDCAGADGGGVFLMDSHGFAHAVVALGLLTPFANERPMIRVRGGGSLLERTRPLIAVDLADEAVSATPPMRALAEKLGIRSFVACRMTDRDGQPIGTIALVYREPFDGDDRLVRFLGVLAERAGTALQHAAELERAREHESALQVYRNTSSLIAAAWDSVEALKLAAQQAHRLVRADRSQVLLLRGDDTLQVFTGDDVSDGELITRADGVAHLWEAIDTQETRVVQTEEGLKIVVPLVAFSKPLGVLRICDARADRELTQDELTRLSILAAHVAVVVHAASALEDLARQEEELRALSERLVVADEAERRRISSELQRLVGERVAEIRSAMQETRDAAESESCREAIEICTEARATVSATAQAARALSVELHPGILDDLGLVPALRWYCTEVARNSGLDVELEAPSRVDVDAKVARAVYRAAQESLNNVIAHANARRARVRLTHDDSVVVLEVTDDGDGFDYVGLERSVELGMGILGMRERVRHLGGSLQVDSAVGNGTQIRLEVPRTTPSSL